MINCRHCLEYLAESALCDEATMAPEVQQHLDECLRCRRELVSMRDAWSLLALSLEAEVVESDMESRLMSRVESSLKNEKRPRWHANMLIKYGLAASVLITVTSSLLIWSRHQASETRYVMRQARELQEQLDQFNEWKRGFARPTLQFVSLLDVSATSSTRACLVHDSLGEEGHFFAFDMEKPPSGRVYKVWVLTKIGQVCGSAVLAVNDEGMASATMAIPEDSADIGQVTVTVEVDPNAASPSTNARLQAVVD